jgi:hypothetical protein
MAGLGSPDPAGTTGGACCLTSEPVSVGLFGTGGGGGLFFGDAVCGEEDEAEAADAAATDAIEVGGGGGGGCWVLLEPPELGPERIMGDVVLRKGDTARADAAAGIGGGIPLKGLDDDDDGTAGAVLDPTLDVP